MMSVYEDCSGNSDSYTKQGRIWELAERNNKKPIVYRFRKVKHTQELRSN